MENNSKTTVELCLTDHDKLEIEKHFMMYYNKLKPPFKPNDENTFINSEDQEVSVDVVLDVYDEITKKLGEFMIDKFKVNGEKIKQVKVIRYFE